MDVPQTRRFPLDDVMAIDASIMERAAPGAGFLDMLLAEPPESTFTRDGSVAVVTVAGPLLKAASFFDGYDSIRRRFSAALADPDTSAVMLKIHSPGGVVAGMFDAARAMRAARATSTKPVVAFADECAFSAAYLLASVADRIVVSETGAVGSIGVLATMTDRTAMNKQLGLRVELVASGKRKTDGNPDAAISEDAIKRAQGLVDLLGAKFAAAVSESRPLTPAAVLAYEADTFMGPAAVKAGLADEVMPLEQAMRLLEATVAVNSNKTNGTSGAVRGKKMKTVLAALGLSEASTELEAMSALNSLKDTARQATDKEKAAAEKLTKLEAAVGKSGEEAIGHIFGLKAKAEAHEKLVAEHAELQASVAKTAKEALVAKGTASGQLSPAMIEKWASGASVESLTSFLAVAPRVIPNADPKEAQVGTSPAAVAKSAGAKPWAEMKPMEKHDLYFSNRALYDALKTEHEQATAS